MKTLSFVLMLIIFLGGCTPVRYVNVEKKHNFYQRHRSNTYTIPIWVPNVGVVLETRIYKFSKKNKSRHRKN
jgi:PBP1b-binding outer membrane lipoprotein LpoB